MSDFSNYTKLDVTLKDIENFSQLSEYGTVYCVEELENKTTEGSDSFDYVYDEQSWQDSYQNGAIKLYYEANPSEDLWNEEANRAANFNDRHYKGTIDNESVESDAQWESDNAQSITINDVKYYMAIFYDFDSHECELFNDVALSESANKTFVITETGYAHCTHCWAGAINAPGAKYPWICPHFDSDVNAKIIFKYEGKDDVYPWGDIIFGNGEDHKAWGCASVPVELGEEFLLTNGETSFDKDKFEMLLETSEFEDVLVTVTSDNFAALKESLEDADLYIEKSNEEPGGGDQPGEDEEPKPEKRNIETVINNVLERKGIDTSNMTEAEKIAKVTGLNFANDEWVAKKKEEGTLDWYIPAGKAWE